MYFADASQHVIRKVDTKGTITTVAGTGKKGLAKDGAKATDATISSPGGVVVAANGALYFSDTGNDLVRRVKADGTLETVAGAAKPGYHGDGGAATGAGLNSPRGLAFYGEDTLLIADHFNHRVRAVKVG